MTNNSRTRNLCDFTDYFNEPLLLDCADCKFMQSHNNELSDMLYSWKLKDLEIWWLLIPKVKYVLLLLHLLVGTMIRFSCNVVIFLSVVLCLMVSLFVDGGLTGDGE